MNMAIHLPDPHLEVIICRNADSEWKDYVGSLEATGFPIPVSATPSFPVDAGSERWLIGLRDADGKIVWASIAESSRSRIVPWRQIIRFLRFGPGLPPGLRDAAMDSLVHFATTQRALRMHVAMYEPDDGKRHTLVQGLARRGFRPESNPRSYAKTVLIDLRLNEESILASFHTKTRRDIRALGKAGLICREISDAGLSARMNVLLGISMGRTGGHFHAMHWAEVITFIAQEPRRAVLIGVFRPDIDGPLSLVGYVLGYRHGDTVQYGVAACARLTDVRAPLLYAPTWELMRWGKRNGGDWFDFGGVTSGTRASGDPAGGISEFKRYFRSEITPVGEEMVYSASPRLNRLARSVSAAASFLRDRERRSSDLATPSRQGDE